MNRKAASHLHLLARSRWFAIRALAWLLPVLLMVSCGREPPEGVYAQEEWNDRTLTLKPDGRFSVQETEGVITGTYRIDGQVLVLVAKDGKVSRGKIGNKILVDPHGNRWRKR